MSKIINLNNTVKFKPNKKGETLYKEKMISSYPKHTIIKHPELLVMNKDNEGYVCMQLWEIMNIFGNHTNMGVEICFESTDLEILY